MLKSEEITTGQLHSLTFQYKLKIIFSFSYISIKIKVYTFTYFYTNYKLILHYYFLLRYHFLIFIFSLRYHFHFSAEILLFSHPFIHLLCRSIPPIPKNHHLSKPCPEAEPHKTSPNCRPTCLHRHPTTTPTVMAGAPAMALLSWACLVSWTLGASASTHIPSANNGHV